MRMLTNPFVTGAKASAVFFRGARVSPLPPALPVATVPALGRRKRARTETEGCETNTGGTVVGRQARDDLPPAADRALGP
jgi:hypothetical protein